MRALLIITLCLFTLGLGLDSHAQFKQSSQAPQCSENQSVCGERCINKGEICLNVPIGSLTKVSSFGQYFQTWYSFAIGAVGVLATVMIMWGGFKWLTSRGNSGVISESKQIIWSALIGVVLAFLSYTILYLINPKLTTIGLPTLETTEINIIGEAAPEKARRALAARTTNVTHTHEHQGSGNDISLWHPDNQDAVQLIGNLDGISDVTTYENHDDDTNSAQWAADAWPSSPEMGVQNAEWIMNHAQDLGVSYVIWDRRIWNPSKDGAPKPYSEWRIMEDRGSVTANHQDHIHISFK